MDRFDRQELDRHITGDWGEDQFVTDWAREQWEADDRPMPELA